MVDKSWGVPAASPGFRIRTNASPEDRAAERARAREARAQDRVDLMAQRLEARAASRQADIAAREQAREARREQEQALAARDPHAAAASRRRSSGRKDVVREQRDTRNYTVTADPDRVRDMVKRGATISGLADVLGITPAEVERILADAG
ncbi:hypothetical protein ACLN6N_14510 [Sphingomonas carotinifaciens]|uniref:hypothetical protein n=1 Tax=Sphingomonas TaxID=13687 RepID=UPI000DDA6732|nr:hypothetical protein [Sphingomonas carotinifaciens]